MKVDVVDVDRVTKKIEVEVPADKITEITENIYGELKRQAKIKGFRPGKIPKSILTTYYKDYIEDELKRRVIEGTMSEVLSEANVKPVTEPIADFVEDGDRFVYTLLCEVFPDIEISSYKGVEVEVDAIRVTDDDIDKRIEQMKELYAEMIPREADSGARKGDFIIVKYKGYLDGRPMKDVYSEAYPLELGTSQLMPEFESAIYDMKKGEIKNVDVAFPDDYQLKDIAGKTLLFEIEIKDIREKRLPDLNDDFAKDVNFENVEKMKESLKAEIEKEKLNSRKQFISNKIMEMLTSNIDIQVPKRLLAKHTEAMLEEAKTRFNTEHFTEEDLKAFQGNIRADFEKKAAERIKSDIILARIAEIEGIKLEDDDVHNRMKKIAEETKRPFDEVKGIYEKYDFIEGMKISIVQQKTMDFLMENANIKEKQ
ncbi:MAG: trigger factor [Syntrophorhabdaceae bacterium]|jgi:trigger factor|nr:trigger factor [Syntrophorhabdaceae bacterium]HQI55883.1 trigger factor [Syntrophorhabdaceae bacterium]